MDDLATLNPNSSRVYTNIQGLKELQYNANSDVVKKEVAQQFEAILMQMVMGSMREANKAFSGGLFGSSQMEMYQDIFDKQLSLAMANNNLGFAAMVEKNIDQNRGISEKNPEPYVKAVSVESPNTHPIQSPMIETAALSIDPDDEAQNKKGTFNTPEEFVKKIWSSAKIAAKLIGATPEILIAQAALETNWGKNIIPAGGNGSTHNLFNIKADSSWNNKAVLIDSLEQRNGVLVKEKSHFRSYGSYIESFMDYVTFLKQNNRYTDSLNKAGNPEQFVNALQSAGYATDSNYADKILKIFSSKNFQGLITKLKSIT